LQLSIYTSITATT